MKVYIDLLLMLNFIIDFLILISIKIILKRSTSNTRIIISSFIGSLTILLIFINISTLRLILIKLLLSIIMILIAFGFININYFIKNITYFYLTSIVLGGFLYLFSNSFKLNYILLFILSPIIIYIYIKQIKNLKFNYNTYYNVEIYFSNKTIKKYNGYLDTGNRLKDPYKSRPIILINYFENDFKKILVPCNTINNDDLLECFKVEKVLINNKIVKNVLIGLSKNKINIDGVDCILNPLIEEEI